MFGLQFASEPNTKRTVTLFLKQQEGGVSMFQLYIKQESNTKMRFAIGFALYTCLIYSASEPYVKRIVTIFFAAAGGEFLCFKL